MRAWPLLLLLAGCSASENKLLAAACEKGDPGACDALATQYKLRTIELCKSSDGGAPACAHYPNVNSIPLDAPRVDAGDVPFVDSITLTADGHAMWNGAVIASDEAVLDLAKTAHDRNPDLRVVIKADKDVGHGRVVHVMDLLKQAGISKIAFGVQPTVLPETSR